MKNLTLVAFLIIVTISTYAQPGKGNAERMAQFKAQKVAFITQELNLTPEEAQSFWPVYNEFDSKREILKNEKRSVMKKCKKESETLLDKNYEELATQYINSEINIAKLQEEYHAKFKKILPIKKVVMLYQADHNFKRHLLDQLGGKGPHGQGRGMNR